MHLLLGEQLSANVRGHPVMGEKDTIVNYPDQIEALVTAGHGPLAAAVGLAEHRIYITPFGFRRALKVQREELQQLRPDTDDLGRPRPAWTRQRRPSHRRRDPPRPTGAAASRSRTVAGTPRPNRPTCVQLRPQVNPQIGEPPNEPLHARDKGKAMGAER